MFLFFHDIGFPWWAFLIAFALIILSIVVTVRGIYVLLTRTPNKTLAFLGSLFAVYLMIWLTFLMTESTTLQAICVGFGLPFGFFAAVPFYLFGDWFDSAIYLTAALLNLIAICGVIEFIERIISKRRLS